MKRLILYDLDGTLVDTREDIACAANYLRGQMGLPPLATPEVSRFVGRGLYHLIRGVLGTQDMKQVEKGAKIYRDYYGRHMLDHSRLYPGALEVLEYFRQRKQAVITNKPNPFSKDLLKALGVDGFFTEIVAGDTDYPKKPDPAAVLAILAREKIEAQEAVFVGDSPIDVETGRNAGVMTAGVAHGFASPDELQSSNPDVLVPDFHGLLAVARKEGW